VIAFLARDDLAHFSIVNQACRSVATVDHVWRPLLAVHFKAVKPLVMWGPTPARQFGALALAVCSVCDDAVLTKPRGRYPAAHSCDKCMALCCAACYCQCSCMADCAHGKNVGALVNMCSLCRGWGHLECAVVFGCQDCDVGFCDCCWALTLCEVCQGMFCEACQDMSHCSECDCSFCDDCRDVGYCESCEESFCSECRPVMFCESCKVSYCDSCGHRAVRFHSQLM
jgi:hypothetical protein